MNYLKLIDKYYKVRTSSVTLRQHKAANKYEDLLYKYAKQNYDKETYIEFLLKMRTRGK